MKLDSDKISLEGGSIVFFEIHSGVEGADFVRAAIEHQGFAAILRKNWCF
jgi:hypothetical protein